jgi:hypothetical protein
LEEKSQLPQEDRPIIEDLGEFEVIF